MRLYRHSRKQRRDRASPKHYRENTAHKAKIGKKRVVITAAVASAVAFGFGIIGYALLNNGVTSNVNAVKTANYTQDYSISLNNTFTWSQSGVTMGNSAEVEFSDLQAGTYTLTISPPAKSSTQADKGYCVITVTDNCYVLGRKRQHANIHAECERSGRINICASLGRTDKLQPNTQRFQRRHDSRRRISAARNGKPLYPFR